MGSLEGVWGEAMHPVMDIHEFRHFVLLTRYPDGQEWYLSKWCPETLLGGGIRLFEGMPPNLESEGVRVEGSPIVAHLKYRFGH